MTRILTFLLLMICIGAPVWSQSSAPIVGDFNGDGKTDVAEWNPISHMWDIYLSCGKGFAPPVQWAGMPGSDGPINAGDLNGDGKTDIFMWNDANKTWSINLSNGHGFDAQTWTGMWGSDGQIRVADLNGDGKSDIIMWRAANNTWSVNLSTGHSFNGQAWTGAWGSDGPIHIGDLNGDHKADVFMWRDSDKVWTVNISTGSGFKQEIWKGAWGSDGPINVGDLNGDGKADVFMWRDSDKVWTVNLSTGSGFKQEIWKGDWGSDGPINVADLNGDGKADVFMWRDADKVWTVNISTGTGFNSAIWKGAWGSDGPINIGDLDGDKKKDVFMWRAVDSTWSVNLSTGAGFNSDSWSSAVTPVPGIKSLTADQTVLQHANDPFVVRYSITTPAKCTPQATLTVFDSNGNPLSSSNVTIDASGAGSTTFSGYTAPLGIQLTVECAANSACAQGQPVQSGILKITGPPALNIATFDAAGNGTTVTAGNNLYVPIGTAVTLTWQVQNCTTNCKVSVTGLDGLNYGTTFFTKTGLAPSGSLVVSPVETNTKYVLNASAASGASTKSLTVQLFSNASSCTTCQWYYFKLTSPSNSSPECFTYAAWASNAGSAQQIAQAQASNYTVTSITQAEYYAGCQDDSPAVPGLSANAGRPLNLPGRARNGPITQR